MRHMDDGTLQEWLDRDRSGMDAGRADEVATHLAFCASCRARVGELGTLTDMTAALLTPRAGFADVRPDFDDVLVRSRKLGVRSPTRHGIRLGWAAAVAVALGTGWLTNEIVRSDGAPSDTGRGAPTVVQGTAGGSTPPAVEEDPGPPAPPPTSAEAARGPTRSIPHPGSALRGGTAETAARHEAEAIVVPSPSPPAIPADATLAPPSVPVAATEPAPVGRVARATPRPLHVLEGRVVDEAGRPLSAAQVFVPGTTAGALTRDDGTYTVVLDDHPFDTTPVLRVELIGYEGESRVLALGATDTVTTDFSLTEQAIALESVVVTGTASPIERRAVGNTITPATGAARRPGIEAVGWRRSSRAEAEARAGFVLLLLPDAPSSSIHVRHTDDQWVVRVVQRLSSGVVVTLTETDGAPVRDDSAGADGRTVVTLRRGALSISAAAAIPFDSLHALLERLR